jgi:hypothetical protein
MYDMTVTTQLRLTHAETSAKKNYTFRNRLHVYFLLGFSAVFCFSPMHFTRYWHAVARPCSSSTVAAAAAAQ